MPSSSTLVVVTPASWLAEDFARAAADVRVLHEIGFDLPRLDPESTLWWCPGSYVARAEATGLRLPLTSAGPQWLPSLPQPWLGRRVEAMTLAEASRGIPEGWFAKPAEIKVASMTARTYADTAELVAAAAAARLEPGSWLTLSQPTSYTAEYRCFVAHARVVASSPYLVDGATWDGMDPSVADSPGAREATAFAQALLDDIGPDACPPGFALDVGRGPTGRWSVIEANASWSANPYHCDLRGVIESIAAAHDPHGSRPHWAWAIDPYHRRHARPLHWKETAHG